MKTLKKTNQRHKNCQKEACFSFQANPAPLLAALICVLLLFSGCQSPQRSTFEERFQANKDKFYKYLYIRAMHDRKVEEYLEKEKEREEEYLQNLKKR